MADACVLPMIVDASSFGRLQLMQVNTIGEEVKAWKRLIPAFTERCRGWKHKKSCEYNVKGIVPLSLEIAESPICTCGRGIGIKAFRKVKEWAHLAQYVTRVAISPLFAVSYLDKVATSIPKLKTTPTLTVVPKQCAGCGGQGKPKLLNCSKCKTPYCSLACQNADWKKHKHQCK